MAEINLENIKRNASNIYEAVAVISKRARQINDEQRLIIESEIMPDEEDENILNEEADLNEIDNNLRIKKLEKYSKPITLSLQEMVDGNIEFTYATVENVDDDEKH